MVLHRIAPFVVAVSIGAFAFRGGVWAIGFTALMPVLAFTQRSRTEAGAIAALYYAAASWPIVSCARSFWFLPTNSPTPVALGKTAE